MNQPELAVYVDGGGLLLDAMLAWPLNWIKFVVCVWKIDEKLHCLNWLSFENSNYQVTWVPVSSKLWWETRSMLLITKYGLITKSRIKNKNSGIWMGEGTPHAAYATNIGVKCHKVLHCYDSECISRPSLWCSATIWIGCWIWWSIT